MVSITWIVVLRDYIADFKDAAKLHSEACSLLNKENIGK